MHPLIITYRRYEIRGEINMQLLDGSNMCLFYYLELKKHVPQITIIAKYTFSVPPDTKRVPLSFIANAYTDSLCPLAIMGTYP